MVGTFIFGVLGIPQDAAWFLGCTEKMIKCILALAIALPHSGIGGYVGRMGLCPAANMYICPLPSSSGQYTGHMGARVRPRVIICMHISVKHLSTYLTFSTCSMFNVRL